MPLRCVGPNVWAWVWNKRSEKGGCPLVPLSRGTVSLCGLLHPMSSMAWNPGQQPYPTLGYNRETGLGLSTEDTTGMYLFD